MLKINEKINKINIIILILSLKSNIIEIWWVYMQNIDLRSKLYIYETKKKIDICMCI